jgi:hypothetical protein
VIRKEFVMALASLRSVSLLLGLAALAGCAHSTSSAGNMSPTPPSPDPRIGLKAGQFDAGEATWNLKVLSQTPPPKDFIGETNSDLSFTGKYVIQGNYHGYQFWDIADPAKPKLVEAYVCPASQSDVSVYRNLLFVSGEGLTGRLDCGTEGVPDTVSKERLRGLRIFDISDIAHPKNVGNVQTCRGSHTHSLYVNPKDPDTVYVYISGSSSVRSPSELAGCVSATPDIDSSSALFRIEVIKVPVAHPEQAAIVSHPHIFNDLTAPPKHGETTQDVATEKQTIDSARAKGAFIVTIQGKDKILSQADADTLLGMAMHARGGSGTPTAADSAMVREALPHIIEATEKPETPTGPTQCHDITLYPAIGLAGGACGGYGLLLDISDPVNPKRIYAVSDSNFSYWHSATFNNDGTKLLFSDEWGGGGQPKCRATDPKEWGADAIFTLADRRLTFDSYYKLPVVQSTKENCVAHNGSLIPIPGRDVMVQSWYQGGISVFDWTDAKHPKEIAFFDRGPMDSTKMTFGGSWSVYWYNGVIVSSETMRGLDIVELTPSAFISKNEIEAAKTVHYDYLNVQGQVRMVWPASFSLARAYLDQLEREQGLDAGRISAARTALAAAEKESGARQQEALAALASELEGEAAAARDAGKVRVAAAAVHHLASTQTATR